MKRKSEVAHQIEPKIPSLSPFLKEEALDVQDIDKDVDDFLDCYNKFVKYVTEIYDKKEKTSAAKAAHFILKFKELNRKAQFRLSISREKTKETKDAINKSHLTMQNLLYEALHLEKETNSCLEYKSLHEEIDLVPLEEFVANAPMALQSSTNDHELTLSRLHWELCERKNLSVQIEEAERAEETLLEEIRKKKEAYSNISAQLKRVLDTTESLEQIFDMPMHGQETQNALAKTLCEPLYVLYTHLRIHADNDDSETMRVTLIQDGDSIDNGVSVLADITESDSNLSLVFRWCQTTSLLTVLPRLETTAFTGTVSPLISCLLDTSVLLSDLPGDNGLPCESGSIKAKSANEVSGIPYVWCQRLAGSFKDTSTSSHRPIAQLFNDIRERVRARVSLAGEINALLVCNSSTATVGKATRGNVHIEWSLSSFDQFKAVCTTDTDTFVDSGLANERCFYFGGRARSAKYSKMAPLTLWLVVPHSYPAKWPVLVLTKADVTSSEAKQSLHLIEVEVNCHCDEISQNILTGQMGRVTSALESLFDYQHAPTDKNKRLFIGGKFPSAKRPFKANK